MCLLLSPKALLLGGTFQERNQISCISMLAGVHYPSFAVSRSFSTMVLSFFHLVRGYLHSEGFFGSFFAEIPLNDPGAQVMPKVAMGF